MEPDNGPLYRVTIGSRDLRDAGLGAFLGGKVAPGGEEVHRERRIDRGGEGS